MRRIQKKNKNEPTIGQNEKTSVSGVSGESGESGVSGVPGVFSVPGVPGKDPYPLLAHWPR